MMELGVGRYWGVGGRRCGACGGSPAAVHCRTCAGGGGGYLCAGCDAGHARAGHERVWVCEVCELAPAAVTCRADAVALCAACDADIHDVNPLARRHERIPVQPIGSSPAAAAAENALLFGGADGGKDDRAGVNFNVVDGGKDARLDFLFADVMDPFLGFELARFPHADRVVPNNGPNGGGYGGEVELDFGSAAAVTKPSYCSYTAASLGHSGSSSEVGLVPDAICGHGGDIFELDFAQSKVGYLPYAATPSQSVSSVNRGVVPERSDGAVDGTVSTLAPAAATGEGREARLMRYREKRKNRRFGKTIRYASRKAYAETRPRIKGRFAKRADDAEAAPPPYMLDFGGYSVVPTF